MTCGTEGLRVLQTEVDVYFLRRSWRGHGGVQVTDDTVDLDSGPVRDSESIERTLDTGRSYTEPRK